ncbi:uncharacterized protein LOC105643984 isoform X2 [Jatropha curcas]|uniref:uncharacterized protein LOC105643984 isoform X2 n=1 Tax=Jatropha curcas TaxID=180498 RepID=UPI0005FB9034|nr:uncharacterized protein LOC105643984 isoform X2 [Jatropha curcas]
MAVFSEDTQLLLSDPTDDERVKEDNCLFSWFLNLFKKPHKSLDNCSFGNFPFDPEGNLRKRLRLKEVKYKDKQSGSGDSVEMVNAHKLQIKFNYDLYNKIQKLVQTNKSDSRRLPVTQDLYRYEFGPGFVEGILGMKAGGIRRIIFPPDGGLTVLQDYAVLDVELLQVCPSPDAPSLDSHNLFGEFPFYEGKPKEEYIRDHYTNVPRSDVKYLDAFVPAHSHNALPNHGITKLKVKFKFNLYYESKELHRSSKANSNSDYSAAEVHLCSHSFGEGFVEGIQGMKKGGIRRIIVPVSKKDQKDSYSILSKMKNYAVFDVELLEFGPSLVCHHRGQIAGEETPVCFC